MQRLTLFISLIAALLLPVMASAEELLAVIVSPGHAKGIKREDISLIYKRKKMFWNDGSKIQPVNLPAANPLRRAFSQAILGATPEELENYWNDAYFHGISPPHVLSSEQAVAHFVADTQGAIGYLPFCTVESHAEIALVITSTGHLIDDPSSVSCSK